MEWTRGNAKGLPSCSRTCRNCTTWSRNTPNAILLYGAWKPAPSRPATKRSTSRYPPTYKSSKPGWAPDADDIDFKGFQDLLGKGRQGEVFRVKQRRFTRAAKVVSLRGLTLFRVILGALALAVVTGGCPPGFVGPYQLKHSGPKGRIVRFREYNESPCRPLRLEKLIHGHVHQRVRKKEATCNYSKFANDEDALDIEPYQESMRRSRSGFG